MQLQKSVYDMTWFWYEMNHKSLPVVTVLTGRGDRKCPQGRGHKM